MTFDMNSASHPTDKNTPKERLPEGDYVCTVLNIRDHHGFRGHRFFLDFQVAEGPQEGFTHAVSYCPDDVKANPRLSPAELKAREVGKIQTACAAALGYGRDRSSIVSNAVFSAVAIKTSDAKTAREVKSPAAGRKFILRSVRYEHATKRNADGTPHMSGYYEVLPYEPAGQVDVSTLITAPSAPPLPSEKVHDEAAKWEAEGWKQHPNNTAYVYKGSEVRAKASF
jgi:hypothetical protein